MADSPGFTTEEQTGLVKGSFPLLWRFVINMPWFPTLLSAAVFCSVIGTAGFQFFVWLTGEYSNCASKSDCMVSLRPEWPAMSIDLIAITGIALFVVTVRIIGWIFCEVGGQWTALPIHSRMVRGIGNVRTTYFDEYPSGKLINRLVRDFDTLRVMGPIRIGDTCNSLIELAVIAAVVAFAHPLAALAVLPTMAVFFYIQSNIAPMMQRCLSLRAIRLGEVLHRETDVIEGVRSFALYSQEKALFNRLRTAVHGFVQMHVMRNEIEAWGRFWSQSASALYGFVALLFVAYSIRMEALSMVLGAVIITAIFRLGGTFGWLTWSSGLLFESAAHVRRVFEYVDLPHESLEEGTPSVVKAESLKEIHPQPSRTLEFLNYSMSYRKNTPVILRELNIRIEQGTKIGVVGRTGAGKTSLLQSLFRMVYVHQGDIQVAGQSLFSLPIAEARALIGVVPQDPYLFEGTVRSNLDRYGDYSEAELLQAIATVQLSVKLEMKIFEGGRNLSLGERQLLCLARVLLSKRPIIVMDEPTSGVDSITDAIMQRVLRTALADRTVITIAHRLETLARVDRILELQDGRIVRDGAPSSLIPEISIEALG